jgi:predicted nucleic acid-binding protein
MWRWGFYLDSFRIYDKVMNEFISRLYAGVYGEMRAYFESKGQTIVAEDLMIGSHALSMNCTLVANNIAEFKRFPGLTFVNWVE